MKMTRLNDFLSAQRVRVFPLLFLCSAFSMPLIYALLTDHIWEDYFITFRHSRNLAEGHGLVYTPGERVHGFTSPLGVLLPAFFDYLCGGGSYLPSLWMFRLMSAIAFALGGGLFLRSSPDGERYSRTRLVFFGVLYIFNANAIAFSANGMETAFVLLFLGWNFYLFSQNESASWRATGACWAGMMWTRPDGCLYIASLAAASLAFSPGIRRQLLVSFLKAGALCTALYLPWFAWAWSYYGSPIPNTIISKGAQARPYPGIGPFVTHYFEVVGCVFQPIYYLLPGTADWYPGLTWVCSALGTYCASYWLFPTRDRLGRMASLTFALLALYLSFHGFAYPWYYPPLATLGLIVLVNGFFCTAGALNRRFNNIWASIFATILLASVCEERACLFVMTTLEMRIQQAEIETGNRLKIGVWLKENIRPGDTIYLEPIGYIGFFSGAKILDWPGLVTPEIVRLAKTGRDFYTIPSVLKPDWLVLRPSEARIMLQQSFVRNNYDHVGTFNANPGLAKYSYIPWINYPLYDSVFLVYHKKSPRSVEKPEESDLNKKE